MAAERGFAHRDRDQLLTLLGHPDRRVRIEAQMTLASRPREADTISGKFSRRTVSLFLLDLPAISIEVARPHRPHNT